MKHLPPMLKYGEPARLFPVLADTSRENRMASIFLSLLPVVPSLAEVVLNTAGVRVSKRTKIETFTEVVLQQSTELKNNRPDGLILVTNGKTQWSALVEAKIGKAELDPDQVSRYLDAAKANQIDAVITISNQFVARADHSPVDLPKLTLRKAGLYHWSWAWLATQGELLAYQQTIEDVEQRFLLSELIRLCQHPNTGVEQFNQMNASWKDIVQAVANQERLKKTSSEVEETVGAWFQELRDLSLQLSRHIGQTVSVKIERKHLADGSMRLKDSVAELVNENAIHAAFTVPNSAADIDLTADLARKTIIVGMKLKAPLDKKSTKARVNWLIRMLKEDDARLIIRAHWPGRRPTTQKELSVLMAAPETLQDEGADTVPHAFEVLLVANLGKRFAGRKTFIEDIERLVPEFYNLVGQHLRAWQPPPPKPIKSNSKQETDDGDFSSAVRAGTTDLKVMDTTWKESD